MKLNPLLAHMDSMSGLVPCKIIRYDSDRYVTVEFTANKGPYDRGERWMTNPNNVVSRKVRTSNGIYFVRPFDHDAAREALAETS